MDPFKMKTNVKKGKLKAGSRSKLVDNSMEPSIRKYKKKILGRAARYLLKSTQKVEKKSVKKCFHFQNITESRVDNQVKLRCRQLPNVIYELRKCILKQRWYETAALCLILCYPCLKLYYSIILRTCFILLFHHPDSNPDLVKYFVRLLTNYVLEDDINKFIKILMALRKSPLSPLESGKYVRKTDDYKVVRDPEFEKISTYDVFPKDSMTLS